MSSNQKISVVMVTPKTPCKDTVLKDTLSILYSSIGLFVSIHKVTNLLRFNGKSHYENQVQITLKCHEQMGSHRFLYRLDKKILPISISHQLCWEITSGTYFECIILMNQIQTVREILEFISVLECVHWKFSWLFWLRNYLNILYPIEIQF